MDNYTSDKNQNILYFNKIKSKITLNSTIDEIDNGVIAPYKNDDFNTGGVFNNKNVFLDQSKYIGDWFQRGGDYDLSKERIDYIDENVVYLGFFINHWGHFFIDVIGRMWLVQHKEYQNFKFAFIAENNNPINENYYQFFDLIGLSRNQIIWVDHPMRFKKVFIPSLGKDKDWNISQEYYNFFSYINDESYKKKGNKYRNECIYLSRQSFSDAVKKERGEAQIEDEFKKNGYMVLYPEKMSLYEQIDIFQNAREIVCINGTIPLNCIFIGKGVKLVVLNKTSLIHNNLIMISSIMNVRPVYIDVYKEPIPHHPRYLGEGPFWIEFNVNLKKYFKDSHLKIYPLSKKNQGNYLWYILTYIKYRYLVIMYENLKKVLKH